MRIEREAMMMLVTQSCGDVRQVLNALQMWNNRSAENTGGTVTAAAVNKRLKEVRTRGGLPPG